MPASIRSARCARPDCHCEVPPGQTYCGPHCANASTAVPDVEARCGCGHSTCNGDGNAEQQVRRSDDSESEEFQR